MYKYLKCFFFQSSHLCLVSFTEELRKPASLNLFPCFFSEPASLKTHFMTLYLHVRRRLSTRTNNMTDADGENRQKPLEQFGMMILTSVTAYVQFCRHRFCLDSGVVLVGREKQFLYLFETHKKCYSKYQLYMTLERFLSLLFVK